jgi:hypothetical protein
VAVNSTKSVVNEKGVSDSELQAQIKKAAAFFKDEKKVKVSIPKAFAKTLGPTVPFGVNGIFIVLNTDGEEVEVNETHAKHIKQFIKDLAQ